MSGLFDMQHSFDHVLTGLPPSSRGLLRSAYYAEVTADPRNPMRVRLRQNTVDRWSPHAPVRVVHSPDDEEVPYEDALVSGDPLRRGGAHVTVEPLPDLDHVNSWIPGDAAGGDVVPLARLRRWGNRSQGEAWCDAPAAGSGRARRDGRWREG